MNVCKGLKGVQVHQQPCESFNSVGILRILEQVPPKKLLDPSSSKAHIKAPIVPTSTLHNPRLLKKSIQEHLQSSTLFVRDKLKAGEEDIKALHISSESLDIMQLNYLENFRVPFLENVRLGSDVLRTVSDHNFPSGTTCEEKLLHDYLSHKISVQQRNNSANAIHRPIFERKVLAIDQDRNQGKFIVMDLALMREPTDLFSTNLFQSLTTFCRNLFMSERCLWSKASIDVMSRARYKRKRLLLPQTRTLPFILSSGLCLTRMKSSSQVEINLDELDSLVFSCLRAMPAHIDRNKNQTNQLLDSLDFVAEHVAKRRRQFLTTCYRAVLKTIHKFDPPIRKWSRVHFETIQSRYEGSMQRTALSSETNNQKRGVAEVIDVDSDESVLEDFLLSDEDTDEHAMNANGLGMLEEIRADLRSCQQRKGKSNGPHQKMREGLSVNKRDFRIATRTKSKVRLKVPDGLVCAPWVIELADQCIQTMERGSIFVPPPLSALPVVAVLTNSYLKHNVRDQRVVIVCESDTNATDCIREYLQRSLGESVSIDTIKKAEHDNVEGIAPLPHTTARLVILDSFSFCFSIPFSLLVAFITTPRRVFPKPSQFREQLSECNVCWWSRIPAVILAPLEAGLQPYSERIHGISQELGVNDILWVRAVDIVFDSIAISTPKAVYLAPPQQGTRILALLDTHAKLCIETYLNVANVQTAHTVDETIGLKTVKLRLIKEAMRDTRTADNDGKHQRLELLYILRQARSFAIFDGLHIAVTYLRHCRKQSNGHLVGVVNRILKDISDEYGKKATQVTHPILRPLKSILKEMEHSMLQDPPSLRSIHRRDSFRPLVVANSQETVDACLQGLQDAAPLPDATETSVAVCPLERLRIASKKLGKNGLREKLEAFSHVFHIIDDRYDVPSDLLLPPSLLQQVHAGRTRLVTIAVDETRKLDGECELEKSWYHGLTKKLEEGDFGNVECKAPYLQQVSLESFWSAARSVFPNCVDEETKQIQTSIPQGQAVNTARQVDTPARSPRVLHLAPNEICAFTVQGLRAMLVARLESLPHQSSCLKINFHVRADESCSPAATYLHSAIAGNQKLRKHVLIETAFSF